MSLQFRYAGPRFPQQGDGLLTAALSLVGKAAKAVIPKHTVVGKLLGGAGAASASAASKVMKLPSLGTLGGVAGAAALGSMVPAPQGGGISSLIPWWKGPGGKLQMPWNDPATIKGMGSPFVLDDSYLKQTVKAPRGYVVVHDKDGKPYPMMREIAIKLGMWHAGRKPPISAGDWHRYQTARHVEKKLAKIARHALRKHSGFKSGGKPALAVYKEVPVTAHRRVA